MRILPLLLTIPFLLIATGCGSEDSSSNTDAGNNDGGGASSLSFETPTQAAESFCSAAQKKDLEALSQCFSSSCEGEFKTLVDKSASSKSLDELSEMFKEATVKSEKIQENSARVEVSLPNHRRKKETLNLVKEDGAWKISGF